MRRRILHGWLRAFAQICRANLGLKIVALVVAVVAYVVVHLRVEQPPPAPPGACPCVPAEPPAGSGVLR